MQPLTRITSGYPVAGNMGPPTAGDQVTGDHSAQTGFGSRPITSGRRVDPYSSMAIGIIECLAEASFLPPFIYLIITIVTHVIVIRQAA